MDCPGLGIFSVRLSTEVLLLSLDKTTLKFMNVPEVLNEVARSIF